jgi:phosphoglycolate phosphatase
MRLLPEWSFHAILGQKQNVPPKPDPVGALEIVRHLDLVPADFLYLGDSAVDMKTAVAAGMFPVGACWGFRTAEELQKSGCQALVYNPMELLNLLD